MAGCYVLEYVKNDTAPAVIIEVQGFDLTGFVIKFCVAFAVPDSFELTGSAQELSQGKAYANPTSGFMDEVGKFAAEIQLDNTASGGDIIQTFRGFSVQVFPEICT
jgi:hypothetical protein